MESSRQCEDAGVSLVSLTVVCSCTCRSKMNTINSMPDADQLDFNVQYSMVVLGSGVVSVTVRNEHP